MRRSLAVAVALALVLPVPLPGTSDTAEARSGGRVTLGGVNVVSGSKTSYVPIRIPRTASIDVTESLRRAAGPNPSVSVKGKGAFVGVVITQDPPSSDLSERFLIAGRFHECSGPACPFGRAPINHMYPARGDEIDGKKVGASLQLPSGDYRLYLIADEGPAQVTLRFGGLSGRTNLRPSEEAPGIAKRTENRKDINTGGGYYGAGYDFEGGSSGIWLGSLQFRAENFQGEYGACRYHGPAPPPEQIAYGVQCNAVTSTGAGDRLSFSGGDAFNDDKLVMKAMFSWGEGRMPPNPRGHYAGGLWYRSQGRASRPESQAFYLSFDDDAPLPDRTSDTTYEKGKRITKWHYEGPAIGASGLGVCTHPIHACALFRTDKNERFMHVKVEDAAGLPVSVSVSERELGGGPLNTLGNVCGETEEPFEITPGYEIIMFPWAVGRTSCPGVATTGYVISTFSKSP